MSGTWHSSKKGTASSPVKTTQDKNHTDAATVAASLVMPFFGKRDKEKESSKKSTNMLKKDDKSSPSLEDRYELKDLLGT